MKLQVKQLDEVTISRITRALNFWAKRNEENFPRLASKYRKISHLISHGELVLCDWQYDAPHDDVQVLLPEKIYVHKSQYYGLMANENVTTIDDVQYIRAYASSPEDDVQVLGPQEKGGEQWN